MKIFKALNIVAETNEGLMNVSHRDDDTHDLDASRIF